MALALVTLFGLGMAVVTLLFTAAPPAGEANEEMLETSTAAG